MSSSLIRRTALSSATALALALAAPAFLPAQELWGPETELQVDLAVSNPPQTSARFGYAVTATDSMLVVGTPGLTATAGGHPGSVLVFEPSADGWTNTTVFESEVNNAIGESVAAAGDWVAFGAPDVQNGGRVYVQKRVAPGTWLNDPYTLGGSLAGQTEAFGRALSLDGDRLVVGDPSAPAGQATVAGRVWAFRWNDPNSSWIEDGELAAPESTQGAWFGYSVDISGDFAAVGEPRFGPGEEGRVHVFRRVSGAWNWQAALAAPAGEPAGFCGTSVALDGNRLLFGCTKAAPGGVPDAGAVHVFRRISLGVWSHDATWTHPAPEEDDAFGVSVAIAGPLALVGASGDDVGFLLPAIDVGSIHVFRELGGDWSRVGSYVSGTLLDGPMRCGAAVAIAGDAAAWGCPVADVDGWNEAGRAFVVAPPLFADGFESGDTSAWSGATP